MTDRVTVGNLRVAQALYDFVTNEALPGTDIDPDSFWAGVDKVVTDLTPENQDLLARARRPAGTGRQVAPPSRHRTPRPGRLQELPRRDRLPACPSRPDFAIDHRRRRRRDRAHRRPAAGGAGDSTPAIALNAANARWGSLYDALYGTDAHPRRRRRRSAAAATTRCAAQGHRLRARASSTSAAPLADGLARDAHRLRHRRTAAGRQLARRIGLATTGLATPAQFVGYQGDAGRADARSCCATTACTSRSRSTAAPHRQRPTPPASSDVRAGGGAHHDHGPARTRSPRSTPTTRCAAYRNWLGLMQGT